MSIAAASLILATFSVGYGDWSPGSGGMSALTRDEERYLERALDKVRSCEIKECETLRALAALETLNLRRKLRDHTRGDVSFEALRRPCDDVEDLLDQRDCYKDRSDLTFEQSMVLAGFSSAGVSSAGYRQLRIEMSMDEVEYILGPASEELSYSSYGGHSAAMYRWGNQRRGIVAAFSDGKLTARSQYGL